MLIGREEACKDESGDPRMADPVLTLGFIAFFVALSGLLGLTFVAFTRMDRDVRRGRMFIMEKRIQRFLGAFTIGFIALTIAIILPSVGVTLPTVAGSVVLVVWLGAMGYGTYELFLIVRPPRVTLLRIPRGSKSLSAQRADIARIDPSGPETHAAKGVATEGGAPGGRGRRKR